MKSDTYIVIAWIVGLIVFAITWLFAMTEWGVLLGLMFGWIPALIAGVVGGLIWPFVVGVVVLTLLAG